ncbi:MAG TPA: hypothetical protein VFH43_14355, partial [Candidatus Kapabacteria bacterium]|nr:hypothetical protein [Candidatus Kapabacteria bacterium]
MDLHDLSQNATGSRGWSAPIPIARTNQKESYLPRTHHAIPLANFCHRHISSIPKDHPGWNGHQYLYLEACAG